MNLLGIDYGTKNIGLAKASKEIDVVLPLGRIENKERNAVQPELIKIITQQKIDKIIVGLPIGLDGSENANTKKVREFVANLKKEFSVPVEFITEIFSSQAGDRMGGGVSRDEKAAMIILQGYLDKNK